LFFRAALRKNIVPRTSVLSIVAFFVALFYR